MHLHTFEVVVLNIYILFVYGDTYGDKQYLQVFFWTTCPSDPNVVTCDPAVGRLQRKQRKQREITFCHFTQYELKGVCCVSSEDPPPMCHRPSTATR